MTTRTRTTRRTRRRASSSSSRAVSSVSRSTRRSLKVKCNDSAPRSRGRPDDHTAVVLAQDHGRGHGPPHLGATRARDDVAATGADPDAVIAVATTIDAAVITVEAAVHVPVVEATAIGIARDHGPVRLTREEAVGRCPGLVRGRDRGTKSRPDRVAITTTRAAQAGEATSVTADPDHVPPQTANPTGRSVIAPDRARRAHLRPANPPPPRANRARTN